MSNKIWIDASGVLGEYLDDQLFNVSCVLSVGMIGAELAIDTLTFEVSAAILSSAIGSTTPIYYYHNGELVGKFYYESRKRLGKTRWQVSAISAIGVLDKQEHKGGIYTGQTFENVVKDIVGAVPGGYTVPFTIDSNLAGQAIYGWLPVATRRANLHQLLFAMGAGIEKDANGDIVFSYMHNNDALAIPEDRTFVGGVEEQANTIARVEVTEHTFDALNTDETVTLFDNSNGNSVSGVIVYFKDAPIHDLTASGLTVSISNCNYAQISGKGTLTGKKYSHFEKVTAVGTSGLAKEHIMTSKDCTLVNFYNGSNVANRLLAYYKNGQTYRADIKVDNEKPAKLCDFVTEYGEQKQGFLNEMDIKGSGILRASCKFTVGYIPSYQGNNLTASVVLTGSGSWTVPAGKNYIVVTLIGGGSGGDAGFNGEDATDGEYYTSGGQEAYTGGKGGKGGKGGLGGYGGKIYQIMLNVSPGTSFSYACANGGAGGSSEGVAGIAGGNTTFGSYSSHNGSRNPDGFRNIFTGNIYADNGEAGGDGADGGDGVSGANGQDGGSLSFHGLTINGGAGGVGDLLAGGGAGGGAGSGSSGTGAAGTDGSHVASAIYNIFPGDGGNGGKGSDYPTGGNYGRGGTGGGGGGGGGGAGGYVKQSAFDEVTPGTNGQGGAFGKGYAGKAGCVIIYY